MQSLAEESKISFYAAQRLLALQRCGKIGEKKTNTSYEIISKLVRQDFTYAMVCYNTKHSTSETTLEKEQAEQLKNKETNEKQLSQTLYWDLTVYLVYDHRANNNLEKIVEKLIDDVMKEQESIFFKL